MTTVTHPSKDLIRAYLARRVSNPNPPPTLADIRRQLGWELTPHTVALGFGKF
jgi:hypothetical protein